MDIAGGLCEGHRSWQGGVPRKVRTSMDWRCHNKHIAGGQFMSGRHGSTMRSSKRGTMLENNGVNGGNAKEVNGQPLQS